VGNITQFYVAKKQHPSQFKRFGPCCARSGSLFPALAAAGCGWKRCQPGTFCDAKGTPVAPFACPRLARAKFVLGVGLFACIPQKPW
jgi:hypothetical protein